MVAWHGRESKQNNRTTSAGFRAKTTSRRQNFSLALVSRPVEWSVSLRCLAPGPARSCAFGHCRRPRAPRRRCAQRHLLEAAATCSVAGSHQLCHLGARLSSLANALSNASGQQPFSPAPPPAFSFEFLRRALPPLQACHRACAVPERVPRCWARRVYASFMHAHAHGSGAAALPTLGQAETRHHHQVTQPGETANQ